jgi:predicted DNA-binding transcriptional regulator AlpA
MVKYVSDSQLAERYDVSRSTIWRWVKRGVLPQPVQISPGCTRWLSDEIESRDNARNSERSAA